MFGASDYFYRLVYIEDYLTESLKQMQPCFHLGQIVAQLAANAIHTEAYPLGQYIADTEQPRRAVDEYVEVAVKAVLERGRFIQLCHQLIGIDSAPQIKRQTEAADVGLIAKIGYFFYLALFYQLCELRAYQLDGGRIRYLNDIYTVLILIISPPRAQADAAVTGAVYLAQCFAVVDNVSAALKIGCYQDIEQLIYRSIGIYQHLNGRIAQLGKVK